jgi:hypothetical protein
MTDLTDRLLADRFAGLTSALDDSDWLDVRRRAGLGGRSRAWIALPLAAALAAIVVGSALALYRDEIDFWSSPPAPERIVVDFDELRARATVGLGADVIAEETRRVTFFEIDGEQRGLFVAPTESGGYCFRLHFIGSCGRTPHDRPDFSVGWLESEHGGAAWINGDFLDPNISRIDVEFEDGARASIPFVWVTEPIEAGFLSYDVPDAHLPAGHRAAVVRAFDADGNELARQMLPFSDPLWESGPDGLPRIADRTQKRTPFDFRDHRGVRWTLVTAPAPAERLCYAYNFGGGCFSPKVPPVIGAMRIEDDKVFYVCCGVPETVAAVELRRVDGGRTRLKPVDEFLLHVDPADQPRVVEIAWLDAEGREVATRAVR